MEAVAGFISISEYTNVSKFLPWIQEVVEGLQSKVKLFGKTNVFINNIFIENFVKFNVLIKWRTFAIHSFLTSTNVRFVNTLE